MNQGYRMCSRCVMDTTAEGIEFDSAGICSYCTEFLNRHSSVVFKDPEQRDRELDAFVRRVKEQGRGKRYDCVVGVSGGVDSSFALLKVVELGLRPLAVHMDNGWNSELAQNNIANLVRGLGVDLYTHVIDWNEYRRLMQAFFDADVIDVELLYDNAMLAVNYEQARANGVKFILSGTNKATEGMRMPSNWNWYKMDKRNIKALAKKFGGVNLKTFPALGTLDYIMFEFFMGVRWVSFLDYLQYNKFNALEILKKDYGYKPYPYKHYESIFTRFYQGYILPEKFGVDKRKIHFSNLIMSGQMTRDEALRCLEGIAYPSEDDLTRDKLYFIKKMGWTESDLEDYIRRPGKPHDLYPSEKWLYDVLSGVYKKLFGNRSR